MGPTVVYSFTHVLFHCMQSLLKNLHWWGYQRVAVNTELLEFTEAANRVRQGGDLVVTDVEINEREEEANRVRQCFEVLEVLADVEDFKVDKVFQVFWE